MNMKVTPIVSDTLVPHILGNCPASLLIHIFSYIMFLSISIIVLIFMGQLSGAWGQITYVDRNNCDFLIL